MKKYIAEVIGTFWLVFASLGAAHFAAGVEGVGLGWLGVSLAFGLTIVTMAYAIGHVSGCHLNPAVSFGLLLAGRFDKKEFAPYVVSQTIGAVLGAGALFLIASGHEGGFNAGAIANGFGEHSPQGYNLAAVFIGEVIFTAIFLIVIIGSTSERAPAGMAPLAIGFTLTLIHMSLIPVSNCSVNPARSIGTAVFQGGWALSQLWVFIVAPLLGAALGAVIHKVIGDKN
ncbi:aquaporin Z [Puniceicoccaceae bacterium K14]|nr:aquaporin Z [Puniceicoccaceae bacterium K14]